MRSAAGVDAGCLLIDQNQKGNSICYLLTSQYIKRNSRCYLFSKDKQEGNRIFIIGEIFPNPILRKPYEIGELIPQKLYEIGDLKNEAGKQEGRKVNLCESFGVVF